MAPPSTPLPNGVRIVIPLCPDGSGAGPVYELLPAGTTLSEFNVQVYD
jgi:hypothetical protein